MIHSADPSDAIDPADPPARFQRLTEEDGAIYGSPLLVTLVAPDAGHDADRRKLERWIRWRAAPYAASRHSEYLALPSDGPAGPRIMLSAVLRTPASPEAYLAEIDQKRRYDILGKKALARGYSVRMISPWEHGAEIHRIIHSTESRQGRPIAPLFADRPADHPFDEYRSSGDPLFADICVGVFSEAGALVAYLLGKRVGDHVQYDEIMGHGEHLANDIMYLLHWAFLGACISAPRPPAWLHYGAWYSGANPFSPEGGLNRWKRKTKFVPAYLALASC
jgi:hypothetical protein